MNLWWEPVHNAPRWLSLIAALMLAFIDVFKHELLHPICQLIARYTPTCHQRVLQPITLFCVAIVLFALPHITQHYLT